MNFLRYIFNYRKNVFRIEQLKNNLDKIPNESPFQLVMARAASADLWRQFRV